MFIIQLNKYSRYGVTQIVLIKYILNICEVLY